MNELVLLIPHYNNPQGLLTSLASIDATEALDIVVVDDGSILLPDEISAKHTFAGKGKIIFIYLESNCGIEHALNYGLDYIMQQQYGYIARLDCGDKCIGTRFEKQVSFLKCKPNVKLVGSSVRAHDTVGKFLYCIDVPPDYETIKNKMFLNSMFIHPTVMFKTEVITCVGNYPLDFKYAEDYAFFFKIINKFEAENIPEYLVEIELNPNGISITKRKQQVLSRLKVINENFNMGYYPIYGMLRNLLLLIIPNKIVIFFKTALNYGKADR